jgi:hypothetical protein
VICDTNGFKPLAKVRKDPQAVLDYSLDWLTDWLEPSDTVVASVWSVTPAGSLVIDDQPFTSYTTTVWLSGGTAGTSYTVTNHITTAAGREDDRSLLVEVADR